MSIPKEPRQQMINMMYLVLTALLALNVSAEVLNAFKLVSDGMHNSNVAMDKKNTSIMDAFEKQYRMDAKKTEKYINDARKVQAEIEEFIVYVQSLKDQIINESGGYVDPEDPKSELAGKKDYDTPTRILVEKGAGDVLMERITTLRANILDLESLSEDDKARLADQITLNVTFDKDKAKRLGKDNWTQYNFDHVPVIATNTILTKFQGDAKTSESLILETLISKIGQTDYKFDELTAKVIAPTSYVLQGQEYKADIFVSALSTTQDPEVYVGKFKPGLKVKDESGYLVAKMAENPLQDGYEKIDVVSGMGKYKQTASGLGEKNVTGAIRVRKPNSEEFEFFPFELNYQVAQAGVVVSPDKMNVLYIGVDNPVSISVPGFPNEKVSASSTQAGSTLSSQGNGKYIAKVKTVGETKIVVSATMPDGNRKQMGAVDFRVKRIPPPIAKIGGEPGGSMKTNVFRAQGGVIADLENFDFDVRFIITGFEMTYAEKRADLVMDRADDARFTSKMKSWMEKAKPGDVFYLDDIKARGPDGETRKLPGIVFKMI